MSNLHVKEAYLTKSRERHETLKTQISSWPDWKKNAVSYKDPKEK